MSPWREGFEARSRSIWLSETSPTASFSGPKRTSSKAVSRIIRRLASSKRRLSAKLKVCANSTVFEEDSGDRGLAPGQSSSVMLQTPAGSGSAAPSPAGWSTRKTNTPQDAAFLFENIYQQITNEEEFGPRCVISPICALVVSVWVTAPLPNGSRDAAASKTTMRDQLRLPMDARGSFVFIVGSLQARPIPAHINGTSRHHEF